MLRSSNASGLAGWMCEIFLVAKKVPFTCQGRDRDAKGEKEGEKAKVGFGVGNPSNLLLVVGMVVG